MSNPLADVLPVKARRIVYAAVWTVGALLGAAQAAVLALIGTGDLAGQPAALTAALAAYAFLAGPAAALAHANTSAAAD